MSTTSKIDITNSQLMHKIISLTTFLLAVTLGAILPVIAIPWMFFLAYLGLEYRKELKGTFHWWLDQAFMAAAIVLGVAIFIALAFVLPWTSKRLI
jgi:hypothetical protein